jgi:DNA polymerase III subunit delta'
MSTTDWGILGHEWAVAALRRALANERVPHALLFVGPPGVGKRTLARTFARALQCSAGDALSRPCGMCRPCLQIAAGAFPDVRMIEPERASGQRQDKRDISIDQIRSLQHQVSLKPYESRWVVGIIADAQEMSDAAANCLLKTLEEPQAHAVLMLTAPDVSQLLPTIVSRCQVFPLRPLSLAETEISLAERFAVDEEQATILAHLSGGRIGWAVRAAGDESVLATRRERLEMLIGLAGATRRQRMSQAAILAEGFAKGQDGRDAVYETLDLWTGWWRDILLVHEGCVDQITNADREEALAAAAEHYPTSEVGRFLSAVIATRDHLERNVNPRLALEALVLGVPRATA